MTHTILYLLPALAKTHGGQKHFSEPSDLLALKLDQEMVSFNLREKARTREGFEPKSLQINSPMTGMQLGSVCLSWCFLGICGQWGFCSFLILSPKASSKSVLPAPAFSKSAVPGPEVPQTSTGGALCDAGVAWILVKDIFLNPLVGELVAKSILYKGVRQKERNKELCQKKLGQIREVKPSFYPLHRDGKWEREEAVSGKKGKLRRGKMKRLVK